MNYLIIAVVVIMVISPIFWIMPSPRQKRQMQLRERAMTIGFQVKLADLPQTYRAQVRKERVEQGIVYRLPWEVKRKHPEGFDCLLMREGQESQELSGFAQQLQTALQSCLDQLPDSVLAVEYSNPGLAIYWREQGGVDMVENLYKRLSSLRSEVLALESGS